MATVATVRRCFGLGSLARDFNDEKEGKEKSKREKRADGTCMQYKGRGYVAIGSSSILLASFVV